MSHKQGKLSPNTPQTNPNAINRNAGLHALEYEEAMEVEQPLSDTSEHDPSSDASQVNDHKLTLEIICFHTVTNLFVTLQLI